MSKDYNSCLRYKTLHSVIALTSAIASASSSVLNAARSGCPPLTVEGRKLAFCSVLIKSDVFLPLLSPWPLPSLPYPNPLPFLSWKWCCLVLASTHATRVNMPACLQHLFRLRGTVRAHKAVNSIGWCYLLMTANLMILHTAVTKVMLVLICTLTTTHSHTYSEVEWSFWQMTSWLGWLRRHDCPFSGRSSSSLPSQSAGFAKREEKKNPLIQNWNKVLWEQATAFLCCPLLCTKAIKYKQNTVAEKNKVLIINHVITPPPFFLSFAHTL